MCPSQADPGGDRCWLQGHGSFKEFGSLFTLPQFETIHIAQRGVRQDVFRVAGNGLFQRRGRLLIRAFLTEGRADIVVRGGVVWLA